MDFKNAPLLVRRAEAIFNMRQSNQVDVPRAVRDYRQHQQAALEQMQKLREQRLAREPDTSPRDPSDFERVDE